MAGETQQTTDRKKIKQWVEERGGQPATVADTGGKGEPGILRIDFPGYGDPDALEKISWEDFFEKFEEKNLLFIYQEEMKDGSESRFYKFVSRD